MDNSTEVKEEVLLEQNFREFLGKDVAVKALSEASLSGNDSNKDDKLEIKEEATFSALCTKDLIIEIKNDAVTIIKTEIKEESFVSENEGESFNENVVNMEKCSDDYEVEIKEELQWQEELLANATTHYEEIQDGINTAELSRFYTEALSSDSARSSIFLDEELRISTEKCKPKRIHKCDICGQMFTNVTDLKRHLWIHEGKKPFKCETCLRSFNRQSSLKRHSYIHENERPHKCNICGKGFLQMSDLRLHGSMHNSNKTFNCDICEKSFEQLFQLQRHAWTHQSQRPYKCEHCDQSFKQLLHLKRHSVIHLDKMPYKCEICEKTFRRMYNLKNHILMHGGVKQHKCRMCEKRFTCLYKLNRHTLIHLRKNRHK